jgi:hypothetical protein
MQKALSPFAVSGTCVIPVLAQICCEPVYVSMSQYYVITPYLLVSCDVMRYVPKVLMPRVSFALGITWISHPSLYG